MNRAIYDQNLPEELKKDASFCLWNLVERNGKKSKLPYTPHCNHGQRELAKSNDISTFAEYELNASNVCDYDGIGLGIFNGFSAIDIDKCIDEEGNLSPMAQDVMNIMDSYTEKSPLGKGLRIVFRTTDQLCQLYDKDKYYINKQNNGLEVYISGVTSKFVTLTGNILKPGKLEIRDSQVLEVLNKYMLKEDSQKVSDINKKGVNHHNQHTINSNGSSLHIISLTDEEILENINQNQLDHKLTALFNGDNYGFKSNSEADMSFFSCLAQICSDKEQILRIGMKSKRVREKWTNRDDYLAKIIEKVTKPFHEDSYYNIQLIQHKLVSLNLKKYQVTDLGSSKLLSDVFSEAIVYVPEKSCWYIFNGKVWEKDQENLFISKLCKQLAKAIWNSYQLLEEQGFGKRALDKLCTTWQDKHKRDTFILDAKSNSYKSIQEFDNHPLLFNCNNGTFNLETMEFQPFNRKDYLTFIAPTDYVPEAKSEKFDQFLNEILSTRENDTDPWVPDTEKIRYLQKALGYAISGDTSVEKLFLLYGPGTRNGKSTLVDSIQSTIGSNYFKSIAAESLAQKKRTGNGPSEDIARLDKARLASVPEPGKDLELNSAFIKALTGNDAITVRNLYEKPFELHPQFKIFIQTNHRPKITDSTVFSSGRMSVIFFERSFMGKDQKHDLKQVFAKPEHRIAILNWLIEGFRLFKEEGFVEPESVVKATLAYQAESDIFAGFIEDALIRDPNCEEKTETLYNSYILWCKRTNNTNYQFLQKRFKDELQKHGVMIKEKQRPRDKDKNGVTPTNLAYGYSINPDFIPEVDTPNDEEADSSKRMRTSMITGQLVAV